MTGLPAGRRRNNTVASAWALSAFVVLMALAAAGVFTRGEPEDGPPPFPLRHDAVHDSTKDVLRLLAVGDVNLGRQVGQILLKGDTLYPWRFVADTFGLYDVVVANLESNLSEQHGITEDPGSNMVFTGPPVGAVSLRRAGITLVSTANNHALDFGAGALGQTHELLDKAGVLHAGSGATAVEAVRPAIITVRGYRLAFFACTGLMNVNGGKWRERVAAADTAVLFPPIRAVRESVDVIVLSVHAGTEYGRDVDPRLRSFAQRAVEAGVDLVLGHHPHVPYAVERWHHGVIAPSLGNFVFRQPFQYWTQRSFALAVEFGRDSAGVSIRSVRCLPLRAGFQPQFLRSGQEYDVIMKRVNNGIL